MLTRPPILIEPQSRDDMKREAGFHGALQTRVPLVVSTMIHVATVALIVWTTRSAPPSSAIPPEPFSMVFEPVAVPAASEPMTTPPPSTETTPSMQTEADPIVPTFKPPALAMPPPAVPAPPQLPQPEPEEPLSVPSPPPAQQEPQAPTPPEPPPIAKPAVPTLAPSAAKTSRPHPLRRPSLRPQEPMHASDSSAAVPFPGSPPLNGPGLTLPSASPAPPAETSSEWRNALSAWLQAHKAYPNAARSRSEEGTVVLRFMVGRDGEVLGVTVVRGSGSDTLDAAAQAIFRNAHVPAFTADMTQTQTMVTVPIHYRLER